jgi:hypothetical protein
MYETCGANQSPVRQHISASETPYGPLIVPCPSVDRYRSVALSIIQDDPPLLESGDIVIETR